MRLKRWLNRSRYDRLKMIYIRYVSITLIVLIYGWLRTDWQIIRSTCRDLSSVSRVILTNANCHQAAKQRLQLPLRLYIITFTRIRSIPLRIEFARLESIR